MHDRSNIGARRVRGHAWAVSGLMLLCAGGCVSSHNERNSVGPWHGPSNGLGSRSADHGFVLPEIEDAGGRREAGRTDDGPSLAASGSKLARGHWALSTVVVPVDRVGGYSTYIRQPALTNTTARQRGQYPTPTTALDLDAGSEGDQQLEMLASGPQAFYEAAAMVPRFFFVQPWDEVNHVTQPLARAPVFTQRYTEAERTGRVAVPRAEGTVEDPAGAASSAPSRSEGEDTKEQDE
jgi:hypothetical protein